MLYTTTRPVDRSLLNFDTPWPRVIRRIVTFTWLAMAADILLLLYNIFIFDDSSHSRALFIGFLISSAAVFPLIPMSVALTVWFRMRRLRRAITKSDGRLCPECGYTLAPEPRTGCCTECGHDYDLQQLVQIWRRAGWRPVQPESP